MSNTSLTKGWVIGSDGSAGAEHALQWGLAQAIGRTAAVRVVRAWQVPPMAGAEFGVAPIVDLEPPEAHSGLDDLAAPAVATGVVVTSDVLYGGASRVLLEGSQGSELLVLGSRGLGGFRRLLVGSVSHQCATHAECPVIVVRSPADDADAATTVSRLVVGVDGSPASRSALKWAHDFARDEIPVVAMGVWAVSVYGAEEMQTELEHGYQDAQRDFGEAIDAVEAELGVHGYFERRFESGAPAPRLVELFGETDLIVVGERGHRGLRGGLLGSVATEVLHHARGPVAVIPAT